MKFLFASALIASAVSAQCSEAPQHDLDLFAVFDTSQDYNQIINARHAFSEGLVRAAKWVEDAGHEVKSSLARANDGHVEACYSQDSLQVIGSDKFGIMADWVALQPQYNLGRPTIFSSLVWVRKTLWTDAKLSDSVRRIFMFVTQNIREEAYEPANGGFVVLPEEVIAGDVSKGCPNLLHTPNRQQWGELIEGAKAGVLGISYASYHTMSARAANWRSQFVAAGVTDVFIPNRPDNDKEITAAVEDGLKTLVCPSWIATTSTQTPRGFDEDAIARCLDLVKPCQDELSEWKYELQVCLQARN